MSRKMMFTLACAFVALSSGVVLQVTFSSDDRLPSRDFGAPTSDDELEPANPRKIQPSAPALRQRFVDLAGKRAQRMSDDELGRAIEEITRELGDQDAAAEGELLKATEQLKSVVEKFPGTPSAERAARALQAITGKSPNVPRISEDLGDDEVGLGRTVPTRPITPVKKQVKR